MLISRLPGKQIKHSDVQESIYPPFTQNLKMLMKSVIVSENPLSRQYQELNKILKQEPKEAEKALIDIMTNDKDNELRGYAVLRIAEILTPQGVEALKHTLRNDADPRVRVNVALVVGIKKIKSVEQTLIWAALWDSSLEVKKAAEDALKELNPFDKNRKR
jgi:hypothetical protein